MSSQEVVDFIQSKISQRDENGELRLLSSIVEEVSLRVRGCLLCTAKVFLFSLELKPKPGHINYPQMPDLD
jgi:hypothetical protein